MQLSQRIARLRALLSNGCGMPAARDLAQLMLRIALRQEATREFRRRQWLSDAVDRWNSLTNPGKLRTEAEHARCSRDARLLLEGLRLHYTQGKDFGFLESGRLADGRFLESGRLADGRFLESGRLAGWLTVLPEAK